MGATDKSELSMKSVLHPFISLLDLLPAVSRWNSRGSLGSIHFLEV